MFGRIQQGISPVFLLESPTQTHQLRMVRFEMVMTCLVMMTCLALQIFDTASMQSQTLVVEVVPPVAKPTQPIQTPAATQAVAAQTIVAPPPVASSVPSCLPSNEPVLGRVELGNYSEGVTILRNPTVYYQVYGNDRATVRAQIAACGPQHEYAADTGYVLNWSYALRSDETGQCRVVGVKVGVRTGMVLPYRAVTGDEAAGVRAAWQAFSDSLSLHENGHVILAEQHAARLSSTLQSYPAGDCYTMGPGVEATANALAGQLQSAQQQHDITTNHGVTQGAVF